MCVGATEEEGWRGRRDPLQAGMCHTRSLINTIMPPTKKKYGQVVIRCVCAVLESDKWCVCSGKNGACEVQRHR